jgi:predicted nucleic acid-binding protein
VADHWVINASPFILLAKAEVIQFLPSLCQSLVVPAGVVSEVQNAHISDVGKSWLEAEGKQFVRPSAPLHLALANWHGGAGEAEVISWALQNRGYTAILDDRRSIIRNAKLHASFGIVASYCSCERTRASFSSKACLGKTAWRRRIRHRRTHRPCNLVSRRILMAKSAGANLRNPKKRPVSIVDFLFFQNCLESTRRHDLNAKRNRCPNRST